MRLRITVLGCGGAGGVPMISAGWGQCDPTEPRNRRTRPSVLVEAWPEERQGAPALVADEPIRILIDTSPDLREQLLRTGVRRLDAVLFTHAHADHVHGLDDLREVNRVMGQGIPCWADGLTLDALHAKFSYVFLGIPDGEPVFRPWLIPHRVEDGETFTVKGLPITAWMQDHGWGASLGFRIGGFAYTTDAVRLPDAAFSHVRGVAVWMIGTLTATPHSTHCHIAQALGWAERAGVARLVLTHMGPGLDFHKVKASLPVWAEPAYDGMEICLEMP